MRVRHAAEVTRAKGPVVVVEVGVKVVVFIGGILAGRFGFPAVAAVEDVLDALVCGKFVGLTAPGGGECAAVEVLEFRGVTGFGEIRDGCR